VEAICASPGRDLSMRELGQEVWLFVVNVMFIVFWESNFDATKCSSRFNLQNAKDKPEFFEKKAAALTNFPDD